MTINWGMGFFLGLKLVFVLISVAIEYYFLVFDKYTEGETNKTEFTILSGVTVLCIIIPAIQLTRFSVSLWPIFLVPLSYGISRVLENVQVDKEDEKLRNKDIRSLEKMIEKRPEIPETYSTLGDIYFKKGSYERALSYYKKAFSIKETTELQHKIKVATKEFRIQKGEIWICSQCGADNPGSTDKCRVCGNSNRPVTSIKEDLIKNKKYIKRWIINGFGIPLGALLLLLLLKSILPSTAFIFFAVCISLAVIYILLRAFFTW